VQSVIAAQIPRLTTILELRSVYRYVREREDYLYYLYPLAVYSCHEGVLLFIRSHEWAISQPDYSLHDIFLPKVCSPIHYAEDSLNLPILDQALGLREIKLQANRTSVVELVHLSIYFRTL
jgi:hypothetical protein